MTFQGIAAISDPVREDVPAAVRECMNAGINVKIVTGDTTGTAKEIGRQIGLWTDKDTDRNIITGQEFDQMNADKYQGRTDWGYKDFDGNVIKGQCFFDFLAKQSMNWVRIRVWNDPYDAAGNGYGGGTNDITKAVKMGQWATKAGMKVLIDFHYSDSWADPSRQTAPKAWKSFNGDPEKTAAA